MRIAVLTAGLTESYQITIRNGIRQQAEKLNIDAWFFPEMPMGFGPRDGMGSRSLFPMLNKDNFDGILISTASYSSFLTTKELENFCTEFAPLPVISVGIEIKGLPSVTIDPKPGLLALLNHLTQDHNYRNFLFIAGPKQNKESAVRKSIILKYLKEHNLPTEPERIRYGDFLADSVAPLLTDIVSSNFHLPIDAIIFANDNMALSAIKIFLAEGLSVPKDILITGFDDVAESNKSFPPLTTVHQPLIEMGSEALDMVLSVIRGEDCKNKNFPTTLVIRESCGCLPHTLQHSTPYHPDLTKPIEKEKLKDIILTNLNKQNMISQKNSEKKIRTLIETLESDIKNFLPLFSNFVKSDVMAKNSLILWSETIALLLIFAQRDNATIKILDSARKFINRYIFLAENLEKDIKQEKIRMVGDFGIHLLARSEKHEIISLLERSLAPLHKGFFFIALYLDLTYSQLFYFHDSLGTPIRKYNDLIFKTSSILPPPLKKYETSKFMISSLNFNEEKLGYLVMDETPDIINDYYTFTWQLSNSLKMKTLTEAQKNYTITLEQEVEERTKELVLSNTNLKEEIENRKAAEKKALTSEKKFRTILETIPFPLAICRISDGKTLYHNTLFYSFLEMENDESFSVKNIFLFERDFQKMMEQLKDPDDIQACESVLLTRNKSERHSLLSTGLIIYEEEPSFILGIHDLTEKRALEKEILDVSDRERRRIGQDLHDDLGQKLAGIAVLSRVLEAKLKKNKTPLSNEAKEIAEYMEESIIQTKKLARGLYPVVLKQQGLPAALKELTELIGSQFGIDCQFIYDADKKGHPFSPETFIQLYRIAQEAVSNAARHSGGDEITIHLIDKKNEVIITISDNGRGMEIKSETPLGLGLTTMEYRSGLIGAELEINSKIGIGTTVSCRVLKVKEEET